ncbi:hypothetical protein GCM10009590_11680 [Brachybacterium alimentarium]
MPFEHPDGFPHAGAADLQLRGELTLGGKQVADDERTRHDLILDRLDDQLMRAAPCHRAPRRARTGGPSLLRSDLITISALDHCPVLAQRPRTAFSHSRGRAPLPGACSPPPEGLRSLYSFMV